MLLVSCSLDRDKLTNPNLPYWTTHLEIPLTTLSFGVDEMMADIDDTSISKIVYQDVTNGDSTLYAFQDTIVEEPQIIPLTGTKVKPFYKFMQDSMGTIELDNIPRTTTPKFTLQRINSDLEGGYGPIMNYDFIVIDTISFTDFKSATFENGILEIKIENRLATDIDNVRINLKKLNGGYINGVTIDKVESQSDQSGSINLNGNELTEQIFVEVQGELAGTNGVSVNIDITSFFIVAIEGNGLIVNEAIVYNIPEQENIIDTGTIPVPIDDTSENKISKATFKESSIRIEIDSEFDLAITLNIQIPTITNSTYEYDTWIIDLARGESSIDTIFSLVEKQLLLYNGNNFSDFLESLPIVSYTYDIELESVNDDERIINASDKINISFSFYGDNEDSLITFSQITGKIIADPEQIGPIYQSPPEMPSEMDDFLLLDEHVEMALDIQMDNIGLPIILNMEIKAESPDEVITSKIDNWDISIQGSYISIPQAANIINIRPESIVVTGEAVVGNNSDFSTINVVDSISMQSNFYINLPFIFKVKDSTVVEIDPELTTPESFDALPIPIDNIETMKLLIDYNNQLGFGADINVLAASDTNYFADISSVKPDTLVRSLFLENNTDSKDSLILTEKQMELFKDSIYIKINVNIFGDEIFFLSTDSLILKLSASMDYLINAPDSTGTPDE